jgi:hypothetical protein
LPTLARDVIRLCTRNPVTLPQRITAELLERLRSHHPIFVSTHFNHPHECTPEAGAALSRLADAGFNVGNQMVLLRGINDDPATVEALNRWLVRHRCRPYYMLQCDPVRGTAHLRTPVDAGVEILDADKRNHLRKADKKNHLRKRGGGHCAGAARGRRAGLTRVWLRGSGGLCVTVWGCGEVLVVPRGLSGRSLDTPIPARRPEMTTRAASSARCKQLHLSQR